MENVTFKKTNSRQGQLWQHLSDTSRSRLTTTPRKSDHIRADLNLLCCSVPPPLEGLSLRASTCSVHFCLWLLYSSEVDLGYSGMFDGGVLSIDLLGVYCLKHHEGFLSAQSPLLDDSLQLLHRCDAILFVFFINILKDPEPSWTNEGTLVSFAGITESSNNHGRFYLLSSF